MSAFPVPVTHNYQRVSPWSGGVRLRADESHSDGAITFSLQPIPSLDPIEAQGEFTVHPLTAKDFEKICGTARFDR
jgi:hypothetical protein